MGLTLKAGTYYIGDPSYITKGNDGWVWIEKMWKELYAASDNYIYTSIDDVEVFVGRTYGGDGVFGEFFVDSGAIAIINVNYLKEDSRFHYRENGIKGTKYISLEKDTSLNYDDGLFTLDDILSINTKF